MTTKYAISRKNLNSHESYFQEIAEYRAYATAAIASHEQKDAFIVYCQFDDDLKSIIAIAVFFNGNKIWGRGDNY